MTQLIDPTHFKTILEEMAAELGEPKVFPEKLALYYERFCEADPADLAAACKKAVKSEYRFPVPKRLWELIDEAKTDRVRRQQMEEYSRRSREEDRQIKGAHPQGEELVDLSLQHALCRAVIKGIASRDLKGELARFKQRHPNQKWIDDTISQMERERVQGAMDQPEPSKPEPTPKAEEGLRCYKCNASIELGNLVCDKCRGGISVWELTARLVPDQLNEKKAEPKGKKRRAG